MKPVVVVVPIYQSNLSELERYSLQSSISRINPGRDIVFIGPSGLDLDFYLNKYPDIPFVSFENDYFKSIQGYSRLLLSVDFYQLFSEYEFMLILQTDAILLKDDLDEWCSRLYDYVGAPWPDGIEVFVNLGRFDGSFGKKIRAHVGNGGLSLRRIRKCTGLINEFPDAIKLFLKTGSSEDIFFGVMGMLSSNFILPNEIVASSFSLELKPEYYYAVNEGVTPMGGHAWWKYNPKFWMELMGLTSLSGLVI